jgi:calcineurin-like phosphoesterase family protein
MYAESTVSTYVRHSISQVIDNIQITDTAGFLKNGVSSEQILRSIVEQVLFYALIIVINSQDAPRDYKHYYHIWDAVKVIVDLFGNTVLDHVGILFTHAHHSQPDRANRNTNQIRDRIAQSTSYLIIGHVPSWEIDTYPEQLAEIGASPLYIQKRTFEVNVALEDIVRWIRMQPPCITANAVYGGGAGTATTP